MRYIRITNQANRSNDENLLRTFYVIGERGNSFTQLLAPEQVLSVRNMGVKVLRQSINRMLKKHMIERENMCYRLTDKGLNEAKKITRYHRLWELYLTQRANISPNLVHDSAEDVEHMLPPELERRISEELGYPEQDPHGQIIPKNDQLAGGNAS